MPEFFKIRVHRGKQGYGFVLSNQAPCVVSSITEGGPADAASLKTGDEILEVNDENVSRSTHEHVVRLLLKYSAPVVNLLVCRYSDPFDNVDVSPSMMEEKEALHRSIAETVDKVVQDLKGPLKLGNFFKNGKGSPKTKRINLVQETSFEKSNFDEKVCAPPLEDPLEKLCLSEHGGSHGENVGDLVEKDNKAIVGYLQTIELPDSKNLSLTSQNVLSNCVKGLHIKSKKITKRFLMHISCNGITLINSANQIVVTYPLKTISYTCCCPGDDRYFGIVTRKEILTDGVLSPYNPKKHSKSQQSAVCSCHIFMVDPDLSSHSKHASISDSFGIKCQPDICEQFPSNSSAILSKLECLFNAMSNSDNSVVDLNTITKLQDDEDFHLHEMLQIRDESRMTKSHTRGQMEVKNFTRSPYKQRKPIPLTLFDGSCDEVVNTSGTEQYSDSKKSAALNSHVPSIEDLCGGGDQKESCDLHSSMDNIAMGKCKDLAADQSLELLLKNQFSLQCFEDFLKKEHSEENIMFWKEIEKFRSITDPVKLRKRAVDIYHTYLAGGAPGLVNVDQQAVKRAEEKLINPDAHMFDLQQQQIFILMKYDCFPRFLKSDFNRPAALVDELEECENKDRKRKTQWHLKMKLSKDAGMKSKLENESTDQNDKKKTLLGILSKGKAPKQSSKSNEAPQRKLKARHDSQNSLSDSGSRPTTPNIKDDRKKFELPKSPSEIKELLGSATPFCRVILPNGSSNVVMLEPGKVIRQILQTCCSRQNLLLSAYDIYINDDNMAVDLDKDSMLFAGDVFHLEKKIQFRFDLPSKRSVAVRESSNAVLYDVIEPIMRKNGYDIDNFVINLYKCQATIPLDCKIATVENKHLITAPKTDLQGLRQSFGSNVAWKPPASGGVKTKDAKTSFRKQRQGSKDDYSLLATSKLVTKPVKSSEELNKFSRRGSLEGPRSYFARLKQGIKNSRATRSKSVDHTKYGLKASKTKSTSENVEVGKVSHENGDSGDLLSAMSDNGRVDSRKYSETSERFRPASEIFYSNDDDDYSDDYFDRRASMPSTKFTRESSSDVNQTDSGSDFSVPLSERGPSALLPKPKNMHLSLTAAMSDPELAVRRNRANNIKALAEDFKRTKSSAERNFSYNKEELEGSQSRKKLPRNLETWRARENSCDSASSSPTEFIDVGKVKKIKREDAKRHSSPRATRHSPRSPQNKQKRFSIQEAEIAIAHSPIYLDDVGKQRAAKVRPLPINIANESEILKGLDLGSYENVRTPDIVVDDVDGMEDSFDGAIERLRSQKTFSIESFEFVSDTPPHGEQERQKFEESKNAKHAESLTVDRIGDSSSEMSPSSPSMSECDFNITVTGSVNDETLIMENKDTGLDLSGLMDMTNMKRSRKQAKQRGEKDSKIKETAITFV